METMKFPHEKEELYKKIVDRIPAEFWEEMAFWTPPSSYLQFGRLDGANRRQVILAVVEEMLKIADVPVKVNIFAKRAVVDIEAERARGWIDEDDFEHINHLYNDYLVEGGRSNRTDFAHGMSVKINDRYMRDSARTITETMKREYERINTARKRQAQEWTITTNAGAYIQLVETDHPLAFTVAPLDLEKSVDDMTINLKFECKAEPAKDEHRNEFTYNKIFSDRWEIYDGIGQCVACVQKIGSDWRLFFAENPNLSPSAVNFDTEDVKEILDKFETIQQKEK